MKAILCCVSSLLLMLAGAAFDDDEGFKPLFDGKTLEGWKAPDMSYWSVQDGAITAESTKEHPATRTCISSGKGAPSPTLQA